MNEDAVVYLLKEDKKTLESIRSLLQSSGLHIESLCDPNSIVESTRRDVPSCLIANLDFGGMTRFEELRKHAFRGLSLSLILVSAYRDITTAVRAVKQGAADFLMIPVDGDVLLTAVNAALDEAREAWKKRKSISYIVENYRTLTPREREVLPFVVNGLLNKQTAYELGTSEITVRIHRGNIMRKMKATSLAHLVKMALSLGIGQLTTLPAAFVSPASKGQEMRNSAETSRRCDTYSDRSGRQNYFSVSQPACATDTAKVAKASSSRSFAVA